MQEKWNKRPLIISGPCSAETEEQVLETATRLAKTGKVDVLPDRVADGLGVVVLQVREDALLFTHGHPTIAASRGTRKPAV